MAICDLLCNMVFSALERPDMPTHETKNTGRSLRQGMKKERILSLILIILSVLCIGCGSTQSQAAAVPEQEEPAEAPPTEGEETMTDLPDPHGQPQDSGAENEKAETMRLKIGETEVNVAWEDNESVDALKELAMYGGFEQVGPIGKDLPREDRQTTTQAGDIVLYSGNQLVIFYGSNSWAYTRLGKIVDKSASELTELLGSGDAAVTLTTE